VSRPPARTPLRRDPLTVRLYAVFVVWGWFLYGFAPAIPLIATEQGITRAQAGLHGTAMAVGAVLAGTVSAGLARRLGRRAVAVGGLAVVCAGIGALVLGTTLAATLTACLVTAVGGNLVLAAAQPALLQHHGSAGPAAVTEANGIGAAVGLLAPLAVGATVAAGWGWRPAVGLVVLLGSVTALLLARVGPEPAIDRVPAPVGPPVAPLGRAARIADATGGFGRTFWLFWSAMICGVAVEFATTFWAADLVATRTGAPAAVSTAAVSALVLGMAASRFILGPLALRHAPESLLLASYGLAAVGFALLWLTTTPAIAVAGLVVAGLGYGAHYPMSVALALRAAGERADQAQAIALVGAGAAIGAAPLLLGALSDAFGPHLGFLLVPALMAAGATAVATARLSLRRDVVVVVG